MSTSVLVTGAGGYIGDGVARAFRRAGYKVYGLTRDDSKHDHLIKHEIIPVIGNMDKPDTFKNIIVKCNIIVDAAGVMKGDSRIFFNYVTTVKANTAGVPNYKPLYIFTSGIMIYYPGYFAESLTPLDEAINPEPTDEREMIPKKKLEDDILLSESLRAVVVRPGFVYGGHGGVIASLFFDINPDSQDLEIAGSPDKRWSWVHVDDLGEAYVKIAKAGSVVNNQVFNIAAPDNPTFKELKVAAAKAAGWKGSLIKNVPLGEAEFRKKNWETNVIINPQKAYDLLGWRPSHVGVIAEIDLYFASWKIAQPLNKK